LLASCCISPPFGGLSTTRGLMTYVLLTRAPLYRGRSPFSLDLHVLGAPLTFVLSQDQTLQLNPVQARVSYEPRVRRSMPVWALTLSSRAPGPSADGLTASAERATPALMRFAHLSPPVRSRPGGTGTRDVYRGNRTQFSRTEGRQRRRPEGCL
jgi:hypothetical protein